MTDWGQLERELDLWGALGRRATFWWRDDDAIRRTLALEQLLSLSSTHQVPVALAVIPRKADDTLPRILDGDLTSVLQHGYSHRNHAPAGEKKCELGPHRPLSGILKELCLGRDRLVHLFGDRFLPILVPPWNRIDAVVTAALPSSGFAGLSGYTPRQETHAAPGLARVNTHVDPIAWRMDRSFLGTAPALELALDHLRARRVGHADPEEPTGLLTHHLDHDDGCWRFVGELLERTTSHPASCWLGAAAAFGVTCARSA